MEWQRELFDEMRFGNDSFSSAACFDKLLSNMPRYIYRYRSFDNESFDWRKQEIDGYIFLQNREKLNDPFDLRQILLHDSIGDYFPVRRCGDKRAVSDDAEAQYTEEDGLYDWGILRADYKTMSLLLGKTRVACFSEKFNSMPMWAHYANGHTGVCFEYDTHDWLRKIGEEYYYMLLRHFFPVCYAENLNDGMRDITLYDDTHIGDGDKYIPMFQKHLQLLTYYSLLKTKEWAAEREWRVCFALQSMMWLDNDWNLATVDAIERLNPFFIGAPSRVYCGYKMSELMYERICSLANAKGLVTEKMVLKDNGLLPERL